MSEKYNLITASSEASRGPASFAGRTAVLEAPSGSRWCDRADRPDDNPLFPLA